MKSPISKKVISKHLKDLTDKEFVKKPLIQRHWFKGFTGVSTYFAPSKKRRRKPHKIREGISTYDRFDSANLQTVRKLYKEDNKINKEEK